MKTTMNGCTSSINSRPCVSWQFAVRVARALKSITGEVVFEALSSLDSICLENRPTYSIEKFVTVHQLSGRPVTVVDTEVEFDRRQVLRRK